MSKETGKIAAFLRNKVFWIVVAALAAATAYAALVSRPMESYDIAIVSIVEIDPITKLRQGFRVEFDSSGFAKGAKITYEEYNAQGDPNLINQVVDQVVASKPDLVYVLGTPLAQALQNRAPDMLLVQGAVTDPVSAGLAQSWQASGRRYIATSDLPPIPRQVALIRELTPNARRIGVLYNPGEANSVAVVGRLREYVRGLQGSWTLVERPIGSTAEVPAALSSMIGNVDAIYLPPDNTAHGAMQLIGQFSTQHKMPLYTTVPESLQQGALAAVGLDFQELGRETARLTLRVVSGGADPARQPILVNENPEIHIAASAASSLGIDVTKFRRRANVVIHSGSE